MIYLGKALKFTRNVAKTSPVDKVARFSGQLPENSPLKSSTMAISTSSLAGRSTEGCCQHPAALGEYTADEPGAYPGNPM